MSDNKVTIDQLDNSAVEAMTSSVGDVSMLNTENKTIVGAISEIVGKKEIANAIGEPLAETDKFTEMGSEINGLLSTFKTNMMNAGVVVESGDKFKALIDKIKGLTEGEGNKGIKYANGTLNDVQFSIKHKDTANSAVIEYNLDFTPSIIFIICSGTVMKNSPSYATLDNIVLSNMYTAGLSSTYSAGHADYTVDIIDITQTQCTIMPAIVHTNDTDAKLNLTISEWYAIGVGEEDTTLRDSLASILENKGVDVTEEDDMASLINKVSTVSSTLSAGDTRILASNSGYSWNLSGSTKAIQTYYIILPGTVKITCEESFDNSGLKTNNYISVKDNISGTTQKLSCNSSTGSYIFDNITVTSDTTITYYVGNSEFNYVITISADIN